MCMDCLWNLHGVGGRLRSVTSFISEQMARVLSHVASSTEEEAGFTCIWGDTVIVSEFWNLSLFYAPASPHQPNPIRTPPNTGSQAHWLGPLAGLWWVRGTRNQSHHIQYYLCSQESLGHGLSSTSTTESIHMALSPKRPIRLVVKLMTRATLDARGQVRLQNSLSHL